MSKDKDVSVLKLKDTLAQKDQELMGKDDMFGSTLLTNPAYTSSTRSVMFNSHLRQTVGLKNPDFPAVYTNYENVVGRNSTGYYKAKSKFEVVHKIHKFKNGKLDDHLYMLIVYDPKKDRYEMIEKFVAEDLTEKFGYTYDNTVLDTKEPGDTIKKGEVLYKTSSYDEYMNYCYGKNVPFIYMLSNYTIEDAAEASEDLVEELASEEIETVKVSCNDNDILLNLYGDDGEYRPFPDIGEDIKDRIVCAKRRVNNNQILFDLKRRNLRNINYQNDTLSFSEGTVIDINIYCNKTIDEIENSSFNTKIIEYLKMQRQYYQDLYDACKAVIDSGSKYSNDISYYYKRAKNFLDPDFKWREDDSIFSNLIIEFVIARTSNLSVGQKITGRYGNKGVLSRIVPTAEMPYIKNPDGTIRPIHLIMNSLTVVNRLNSEQLYEQSTNFLGNRAIEHMKLNIKDPHEKKALLIDVVSSLNTKQGTRLKEFLDKFSDKELADYMTTLENSGRIYFHNPPMWEDRPKFDKLVDIYKKYDWLKPYDVYIKKFGREIKIMRPLIVGEMYILKLKQTSKKGFSVRSTSGLSKKGLPEKTNKTKIHQELYSKTPIRVGDQENINSAIGIDTMDLAEMHLMYRSSVIGRRVLGEELMTELKMLDDFPKDESFTNRNVEILNAYFMFMGIQLKATEDVFKIGVTMDKIQGFEIDGVYYLCTKDEFEDIKLSHEVRTELEREVITIGTREDIEERVEEEVARRKLVRDGKAYLTDKITIE